LFYVDVKLAQSNAILRYVGRLGKLNGDTEAEFAKSEMLIEEANDIFMLGNSCQYSANKTEAWAALFAAEGKLAVQLAYLEKLIAPSDKILTGHIAIVAVLNILCTLEAGILDNFPNIKAVYDATLSSKAFDGIRDWGMYFSK